MRKKIIIQKPKEAIINLLIDVLTEQEVQSLLLMQLLLSNRVLPTFGAIPDSVPDTPLSDLSGLQIMQLWQSWRNSEKTRSHKVFQEFVYQQFGSFDLEDL